MGKRADAGLVYSYAKPMLEKTVCEFANLYGTDKSYVADAHGDSMLGSVYETVGEILDDRGSVTVEVAGYHEVVPLLAGGSNKPKAGFIYIVTDGEYVKIGQTKERDHRLGQLQVGNPRKIVMLQEIETDDMDKTEQSLHFWYRKFHIRGEWFDLLPLFGLSRMDYIEYMLGADRVRHEYTYSINFIDGTKTRERMTKLWIRPTGETVEDGDCDG